MRIRSKFLILFFALSLGPLAAIGVSAYRGGRAAIAASLGQLFELGAARAAEALEREFAQRQATARAWAGLELMQDVLTDDLDGRISSFLVEKGRGDTLVRAMVTDPAGRVVAATGAEWMGRVFPELAPTASVSAAPCAQDFGGSSDARTLLTCAMPIRALFDETHVLGTLHVSWDLAPVFHRLQGEPAASPRGTSILVLAADGVVVSAPDQRGLLRTNLVRAGSDAARRAGAGGAGFLVESLDDHEYLIGYAHSAAGAGASTLVLQDTRAAFAPVLRLRNLMLSVGGILALAAIAVSFVLSRRVSRPLLELAGLADHVAAGDLGARIEPRSQDEIGALARTFNRMVEDLRNQREQLVAKQYVDSIISRMADGLIVVDAAGVVQRANDAFRLLAGAADEVAGRPAGAFFAEGEEAFRARVLAPAALGQAVHGVELRMARGDGEAVLVTLSAGALPAGAGAAHVVCIATDITPRKQAEEALVQALDKAEAGARAKAQFLAVMSHEIRTPLNGVIGMTDLLAGSRLTPEQRDWAEAAQRCGEGLLALLNDILDASRMDAGRLELEAIAFDPRSCLEAVADVVGLKAAEKGLELSLSLDPALPARLTGDPARLRQVLLNLGSNAVKFTARGHVLIRAQADGPGRIRCLVTDTGIGIPDDMRARLFQPFSQGDSSTTRRYGGSGLGLSICRQLVELMKGEIGVDSRPGEGSTFWFTAEMPAASPAPAVVPPAVHPLRGLRVLVVDDNATNRQVMAEMLRAWGCLFEEAVDAWHALDMLREAAGTPRAFQLALVDFQMPEMDGGQLAAEIGRDPRLLGIPLILVTSVPEHGDAARMMDLGFHAYLTKPLKQSVLHDAIAAVIGPAGARPRPALTLVTAHTVEEAARARNRILVVDDNALNVRTAVGLLQRAGFDCDVASSGEEAVRAAARIPYRLVLMDCDMPGMTGYEAARLIRQQETAGPRTPIVAMTRAHDATRQRCAEAGMDDSIRQPPRSGDVRRVLARYLGVTDPR